MLIYISPQMKDIKREEKKKTLDTSDAVTIVASRQYAQVDELIHGKLKLF